MPGGVGVYLVVSVDIVWDAGNNFLLWVFEANENLKKINWETLLVLSG